MALTTLLSMEKRKVNEEKRASRRCQPAYHSSPFDKYLIGTTGCATHNNNQTHSDKKNTNQERWNSTEMRWRHSHYMIVRLAKKQSYGRLFYCWKKKSPKTQLIRIDFLIASTKLGIQWETLALGKFLPPTKAVMAKIIIKRWKTFWFLSNRNGKFAGISFDELFLAGNSTFLCSLNLWFLCIFFRITFFLDWPTRWERTRYLVPFVRMMKVKLLRQQC